MRVRKYSTPKISIVFTTALVDNHHLPGEVAEVCEQPGKGLEKLHTGPSRILGGREQKKRPLPQKKSAAKVSVFQYAPGPKSVVTKRYNARRRVPYSLLP